MTCRQVCARLAKYQDGDLRDNQRAAVEEHLRGCEACAREWAQLQAVVALVEDLPEAEPSSGFTAQVMRAVAHEPIEKPLLGRVSQDLAFAALALILSVAIVAGAAGVGPVDLSGWQLAFASLSQTAAKMLVMGSEVGTVLVDALLRGLGRPLAWLLLADVLALAVVLAAGRRLRSARPLTNLNSLVAL